MSMTTNRSSSVESFVAKEKTFLDDYRDAFFLWSYRWRCFPSREEAEADWLALKQFAVLCQSESGVLFTPPRRVDRILHYLLENERPLRKFSTALRGWITHSDPGQATWDDIKRTMELSRKRFGAALNPEIWANFSSYGCRVFVGSPFV